MHLSGIAPLVVNPWVVGACIVVLGALLPAVAPVVIGLRDLIKEICNGKDERVRLGEPIVESRNFVEDQG